MSLNGQTEKSAKGKKAVKPGSSPYREKCILRFVVFFSAGWFDRHRPFEEFWSSEKKKNEFREAREFQISVGLINSLLILNLSAEDRFRKGGHEFVELNYVEQY